MVRDSASAAPPTTMAYRNQTHTNQTSATMLATMGIAPVMMRAAWKATMCMCV